jgi:hypothetical protein
MHGNSFFEIAAILGLATLLGIVGRMLRQPLLIDVRYSASWTLIDTDYMSGESFAFYYRALIAILRAEFRLPL